jgi:hypothetical protein
MSSANLALGNTSDGTGTRAGAVVSSHIMLKFLGVGAGGRFPS